MGTLAIPLSEENAHCVNGFVLGHCCFGVAPLTLGLCDEED